MAEHDSLSYPPRGLCREEAARYIGVGSYADRHGKQRWRFRRGGIIAALPGNPGDERFEVAYAAALAGQPLRRPDPSAKYAPHGVIYVIQGPAASPVKIGFSTPKSILRRLPTLQTGNPHPLRIVATALGYPRHERMAHAALASDRLIGEWFAWNERTRRFIDSLPQGVEVALAIVRGHQ